MHSKHKIVPFSSGGTHSKMAAGKPSAAIGRAQSDRPMGERELGRSECSWCSSGAVGAILTAAGGSSQGRVLLPLKESECEGNRSGWNPCLGSTPARPSGTPPYYTHCLPHRWSWWWWEATFSSLASKSFWWTWQASWSSLASAFTPSQSSKPLWLSSENVENLKQILGTRMLKLNL